MGEETDWRRLPAEHALETRTCTCRDPTTAVLSVPPLSVPTTQFPGPIGQISFGRISHIPALFDIKCTNQ